MASSQASPGNAPKAMSSRLLTMKFMQRAAASTPTNSLPRTPEEPSPKRRKKDADSSPPKFDVEAVAGHTALQTALAEEEAKRQALLDKQAAELGDTRWMLNFEDQKVAASTPAVRIIQTGFASLDNDVGSRHIPASDDHEERPAMVGRRSFGRFNKALEKQHDPSFEDSESESTSDEEGEASESDRDRDSDDPNGITDLIKSEAGQRAKAERKAKKKEATATAAKLAKKRQKKLLKLNETSRVDEAPRTSLTGRQKPKKAPMACFRCGGPHMIAVCPEKSNR